MLHSEAGAAQTDNMATYEVATVSVTVISLVVLRPSHHGIKVRPSGRFPSDLVSPWSLFNRWNASFCQSAPDKVVHAMMTLHFACIVLA